MALGSIDWVQAPVQGPGKPLTSEPQASHL